MALFKRKNKDDQEFAQAAQIVADMQRAPEYKHKLNDDYVDDYVGYHNTHAENITGLQKETVKASENEDQAAFHLSIHRRVKYLEGLVLHERGLRLVALGIDKDRLDTLD